MKKKKITITKDFYIMNKEAKYFCGIYGGEFLWTDKEKEAKTFDMPEKITMIHRYAPEQKAEIIYITK